MIWLFLLVSSGNATFVGAERLSGRSRLVETFATESPPPGGQEVFTAVSSCRHKSVVVLHASIRIDAQLNRTRGSF